MKRKFQLKELEVQSFITSLQPDQSEYIKGAGTANTCIQFERSITLCQLDSSAQVCGTNTLCPTTP